MKKTEKMNRKELDKKVTFIFLEASIETIPPKLQNRPSILKESRRRNKKPEEILLDDSKHHFLMRSLENFRKRGRPDILHMCLLSVLDSRASKYADIYVHTQKGELIKFSNKLRLPRNYNRFVGLVEDLFVKKSIRAQGETLIEFSNLDLEELLNSLESNELILFTEKGRHSEEELNLKKECTIMIGAFPHGDFEKTTLKILEKFDVIDISLGSENLTSLYVTNRIICLWETKNLK